MFVKQVLRLLLFLTILYAENVIGVQPVWPNYNGSLYNKTLPGVSASPSSSHLPSTATLESSTNSSVIQSATEKPTAVTTLPSTSVHTSTVNTTIVNTSTVPSTTQPPTTTKLVPTSAHAPNPSTLTTSVNNETTKQEPVVTTPTSPSTTTATTNVSATMSMERKNGHSTTTTAGIVALVCVTIASTAFASLLAWRYVYRKRHGNREILINEEDVDFNDEDLRHFEATCIQLEPDA